MQFLAANAGQKLKKNKTIAAIAGSKIKRLNDRCEAFDSEKWVAAATWLMESRDLGRRFVYTAEVIEPVSIASRGLVEEVKIPKLSDKYFADAGRVARIRATEAGYRLADVIQAGLKD